MDRSRVAVIIPAYNEEKTIQSVIRSLKKYNVDIIVVDDNSSDNTHVLASNEQAKVVKHCENLGYEKAIETGFETAISIDCGYAITFDADGQHDPSLIPKFTEAFSQGYELVLAVRNRFPRFSEYLFSYFSKFAYGMNDPLCGMKGYSLRLYKTYGAFDKYQSIGTELAFFGVSALKLSFIEFKFNVRNRIDESRYGHAFRANWKILLGLSKVIKRFGVRVKK